MPVPEFIVSLREQIGTRPLWLSGVTAVVLRGSGTAREMLIVRRADTGAWTPVTGIIDPGEQPAVAAAREVLEEADIVAVPERLARVGVVPMVTYENGDQAEYLDLTFVMRWVSGDPNPADGENTDARWVLVSELPAMSDDFQARVSAALADEIPTRFER